MRRCLAYILSFLYACFCFPQAYTDLSSPSVLDEFVSYSEDSEYSAEELQEALADLSMSPLDINSASAEELLQFPFMTMDLVKNLSDYIAEHGKLLSVNELRMVKGFDWNICSQLMPFVTVEASGVQGTDSRLADRFRYAKSELTTTAGYMLQERRGYGQVPDSVSAASPGTYFRGSPLYNSLKYRFYYKDKLSIGVVGEKDAGEPFMKGANRYGYDFYSMHFFMKDMGLLKTLAVGDYKLSFGRGLVVNNSIFMGKSIYSSSVLSRPGSIRRHYSTDENNFFRGLAATLGSADWQFSFWGSYRKVDASVEDGFITSLKKDGRHRTLLDEHKERAASMLSAGGNLSWNSTFFRLGLTASYTSFDKALRPVPRRYNLFYPSGAEFFNASFSYDFMWKNLYFSGELATDRDMNIATVNMLNVSPAEGFRLFMLYRYYSPRYNALHASSFASGSGVKNENGFYASVEVVPCSRVNVFLSADYYVFPWLRYNADRPGTSGTDVVMKTDWLARDNFRLTLDWRFRRSEENMTAGDGRRFVGTVGSHLARLTAAYSHEWGITFRSVLAWRRVKRQADGPQSGFLFMQSAAWKPSLLPLELCLNYGQFDTDDYDSRIYSYESSYIRSMYSPAYYGEGTRFSCSLRWKLRRTLVLAVRYSHIAYDGKDFLGSGGDMIQGDKRDEINAMLRVSF